MTQANEYDVKMLPTASRKYFIIGESEPTLMQLRVLLPNWYRKF